MTKKELFYFVGECLMLNEHPGFRSEILEKINEDEIDWQKFVALCSSHLILPVIYLKFGSHDILEHLPDELSEYLKEIYDLNRSRNDQILLQLQDITDILNKKNIYPVFLKGAGNLLDDLYTDIGERMLADIDLLVPEKDYILSIQLLESEGYSKISGGPLYFDIESKMHYYPIAKSGFPASVEIHRLSVKEEFDGWFNYRIIDPEKKSVMALEGCYVLSDNHKIIHNFIHSQLIHEGHLFGIVSYRDLYDLYLLSKRSDIKQSIQGIKCKQKAIVYFVFAGKVLGLDDTFFPKGSFSAWLFLKKHDLNMNSATLYYIHRSIVFITNRIFILYIGKFIKSIYSKKVRRSVYIRLGDPKWYITHLNSYTTFFARKK